MMSVNTEAGWSCNEPSKDKSIRFIWGLSAYRAVNKIRFGYKNQSASDV